MTTRIMKTMKSMDYKKETMMMGITVMMTKIVWMKTANTLRKKAILRSTTTSTEGPTTTT